MRLAQLRLAVRAIVESSVTECHIHSLSTYGLKTQHWAGRHVGIDKLEACQLGVNSSRPIHCMVLQ
jgi:hypothetical protein